MPAGPLTVEADGRTFEIPRRYVVSQYVAKQTKPWASRKFNIAFWLSDRQPPAKMPLGIFMRDFWPPEAGRRGDSADFLVNLFVTQRASGPGGKWVHPLQMAEVTLSNAHWLGEDTRTAINSLDCHAFKPRDYPHETYFKMCASKPGASPEIYLVTSWLEKKPEEPYWRMDAWFEADGLLLNILFPEAAFSRWREIVDASFALVRSWRTPP